MQPTQSQTPSNPNQTKFVAAILRVHHLYPTVERGTICSCGWAPEDRFNPWKDWPEHAAEILIRELSYLNPAGGE